MTTDQKTAIKAMLHAFDRYGANRLCGSTFMPDVKKHPNYMMGFGEAYYICREMIDRDNEKDMTSIPRWIPVSEDLPEDIKPVQITWKNNDPETYYQDIKGKHFTGTAHYKDDKWYWYSDVTEDLLAEYGRCDRYEFDSAIEVVAWMPMPDPYETESENEK